MGTARALVAGSRSWPPWTARVARRGVAAGCELSAIEISCVGGVVPAGPERGQGGGRNKEPQRRGRGWGRWLVQKEHSGYLAVFLRGASRRKSPRYPIVQSP